MTTKTKLIIISVLSFWAFFNAFYLSYDWLFSIESAASLYFPVGDIIVGGSFCDINEKLSCSTVLQHPLSQIYGVPFPVFAMVVYPIIILVALLWMFGKIKNVFKILVAMWVGGIMFNGYFIYQEIFNIGAFCPLCLLCTAIIIIILWISMVEVRKECKLNKKKM